MKRPTSLRFPRKGYGNDQWLTIKQVAIAEALGVEWFPTQHGETNPIDCPTPEICGWFCSPEDEQKIKRLEAVIKETK